MCIIQQSDFIDIIELSLYLFVFVCESVCVRENVSLVRPTELCHTCDDVLDGAIFALVDVAAVFTLFPPQLGDQLRLLPLALMRR